MGPPGAGKGTQAKRLVDEFGMTHLSSGDIFRAEKASGSQLGREIDEYMAAGHLVPDKVVVDVMTKAITSSPNGAGLLLDGFPRTVPQAETLDAQLARAGKPLDAVVIINAEERLIVERITGRRVCPKCDKVYHVKNMPPRRDGVCDECGTALIQRADDVESVVRRRLAAYYRQTAPVVDYYRRRKDLRLMEFNGAASAETVAAEIVRALKGPRPKC